MNKNKLYLTLLLILTLSLTGCSATYNININNNNITEELIINNYDNSTWNNKVGNETYKEIINQTYKTPIPVLNYTPGIFENNFELEGYDYYTKNLINTSNNYGLKLSYKFNKDNYKYSTIVNNTYNIFDINNSKNNTVINVYGDENIFETYTMLEEIKINVTLPYKVIYHNSDTVSNNTYTWNITKENVSTKQIILKYQIEEQTNNTPTTDNKQFTDTKNNQNNKLSISLTIIISIILLIISIATYMILNKKFKDNNKI